MRKRKTKAERRENDHYVTPAWSICRFLEKYRPPIYPDAHFILDPCAARGELIEVAKPFFPHAQWAGCEIDRRFEDDLRAVTRNAVVMGDFLQSLPVLRTCHFDFVLTNPPYHLAEEFIRGALQVAPVASMLLRINFLASQRRRRFLAETKPGIFVLPNRPSFTGDGGDMTEYAWFVFGDEQVAGRIEYLDITPLEVIKAANERARLIHGEVAA
jgi:hypothetical protein